MKKLKVGQIVKYESEHITSRPNEDMNDGIENKYTILEVNESGTVGYIYPFPNSRGIRGAFSRSGKFTWEVCAEQVELIEEPRKIDLSDLVVYDEPEEDEFDENCVAECRPAQHKCGK